VRALVLGGNGFIGSHLVDKLLSKGFKVRVFDRMPEKYREPLDDVDYRLAAFDDIPALAEALEGVDIVYHFISTTVPSTSNLDPIGDINGNLVSTLKLLQLMIKKDIGKIVYLSSGGTVYGIPKVVPIAESHALNPICSYGVVKIAIENYLEMFNHLYGLKYVTLRASNPYGERQGHSGVQGVIGTFINKVINKENIEIWGNGSVVRDFIYVADLIDLCLKAAASDVSGVFNAGSGEGYSINQILAAINQVSGSSVEAIYKAGRDYDVPEIILDVSNAKKVFGWEVATSLEAGIEKNWQWAEKQFS